MALERELMTNITNGAEITIRMLVFLNFTCRIQDISGFNQSQEKEGLEYCQSCAASNWMRNRELYCQVE